MMVCEHVHACRLDNVFWSVNTYFGVSIHILHGGRVVLILRWCLQVVVLLSARLMKLETSGSYVGVIILKSSIISPRLCLYASVGRFRVHSSSPGMGGVLTVVLIWWHGAVVVTWSEVR